MSDEASFLWLRGHLNLSGLCLEAVPVEIAALKQKVQFLDLSDNVFHDVSPIDGFRNVQWLDLSKNMIAEVPKLLAELPKLNQLWLDRNPVADRLLHVISNDPVKTAVRVRAYCKPDIVSALTAFDSISQDMAESLRTFRRYRLI